jgi:hypothetical protein
MNNHPLAMLHDEIIGCVDAGFNFLPIFMAATIPDMCAALEDPNGRTAAAKYKAWFNRWVAQRMTLINAEDCYNLRCGLIHQGRLGGMMGQVNRVVFPLPGKMFPTIANNIHRKANETSDTYVYDIASFCSDMIASSQAWWQANENNATVIENAIQVIKLHPLGDGSSINGLPVLA